MGLGAPLFKAWLLISGKALSGGGGSRLRRQFPILSHRHGVFFSAPEEEACILM